MKLLFNNVITDFGLETMSWNSRFAGMFAIIPSSIQSQSQINVMNIDKLGLETMSWNSRFTGMFAIIPSLIQTQSQINVMNMDKLSKHPPHHSLYQPAIPFSVKVGHLSPAIDKSCTVQ